MRPKTWLILISLCLWIPWLEAASLRVAWTAPTLNEDSSPLTDLAGYRLHYGLSSGNYTTVVEVGLVTEVVLGDLQSATEYFIAATAHDHSGNESVLSAEVSAMTPIVETELPIVSITTPTEGARVRGRVTIAASASDAQGINRVEFLVNNTLKCVDGQSPYQCVWQVPGSKGKYYRLRVRAIDQAGQVGLSPVVNVRSY